HFEDDVAGAQTLKLKFGEGTVEHTGKSLKLHATGKFAAFTIPVDPAKATDWSTLAIRVKSDGATELAVSSDAETPNRLQQRADAPAPGQGPRPPQGLFPTAGPDKKEAKKEEQKGGAHGADAPAPAAAPADGTAGQNAGAPPAPAPAAPNGAQNGGPPAAEPPAPPPPPPAAAGPAG